MSAGAWPEGSPPGEALGQGLDAAPWLSHPAAAAQGREGRATPAHPGCHGAAVTVRHLSAIVVLETEPAVGRLPPEPLLRRMRGDPQRHADLLPGSPLVAGAVHRSGQRLLRFCDGQRMVPHVVEGGLQK